MGRPLLPLPLAVRRPHRALSRLLVAPMIDAEGEKMVCAYCLLTAEDQKVVRIGRVDAEDTSRVFPITNAGELAPWVNGRNVFRIDTLTGIKGDTTCMPATVVNGTWVCTLHVRESVMAWDRRRFG